MLLLDGMELIWFYNCLNLSIFIEYEITSYLSILCIVQAKKQHHVQVILICFAYFLSNENQSFFSFFLKLAM